MLVVRTTEDPANSVGELISAKQSLGLCNLAFAVDPLGLYSVEPRALGGQRARYYPNPMAAGFDLAVVSADPTSHLVAFVPACVVPDQQQGLLASRLEPVPAPLKKPSGYGAHESAVDEPYPSPCEIRQVQSVAGERFGIGIVLARRFLEEVHRVARLGPGVQARPLKAREPGLILEAQDPLRMAPGEPDQPISIPFFGRIRDRGSPSSVWPASSAPQALPASPGWSRHLPAFRLCLPRSSLRRPSQASRRCSLCRTCSGVGGASAVGTRPCLRRRRRGPLWDARSRLREQQVPSR